MDAQAARVAELGHQILADALNEVICGGPEATGCDGASLEVLERTLQVSDALQSLRLGSSSGGATAAGGGSSGRSIAATPAPAAGPAVAAASAAASADDAHEGIALFSGTSSSRLGAAKAGLLAEALPSEAERQQALQAVLPALEAELQRRCRLVAQVSGYDSADYSGLPDHMRQLLDTSSSSGQVEAWKKAAEQAQQAVQLLQEACQLLSSLIQQHKLGHQKASDEAQAESLHAKCTFYREKLKTVQLQLQQNTYTKETVPVLRKVAAEVEGTLARTTAQLQQATLRLQQYRSMGPLYDQLARQHAAVLQQLEETEYELQEIEQFRQLAQVTG